MPLARQTINPLWHYPCSPSAILTQSRLRATTRPTRRAPSRYLASPEPQSPARSYHVRLQPNPPPVPQPVYLEGRPFAHEKPLSRDQELRDQANIRALDIRSAYQELRRFANQGNYSHLHLQTCVRILVKERGQKPNLRLYDALLLANTDHEYGSAAEVATILDDITNEGLTPESATYHAALKVRIISHRPTPRGAYVL